MSFRNTFPTLFFTFHWMSSAAAHNGAVALAIPKEKLTFQTEVDTL
ncbi:MAG: hypothetical protein ACI8V2_002381 [Candidatus Latescibacterota bacterium]|jgi:hypothetical protein